MKHAGGSTAVSAALVALLLASLASGKELLMNPNLSAGIPADTVKGWEVFGPMGGVVRQVTDQGATLATGRGQRCDGSEVWQGALVAGMIEAIPGRRYRMEVEARGLGPLDLGVLEFGWKYSSAVLNEAVTSVRLAPNLQRFTFDYTPTADRVAYVRPLLRVRGWLNRAELKQASFQDLSTVAPVEATLGHFLVAAGDSMPVTIRSDHYPVKLLLYGSSGTSGPGGDMGGSPAFCDHFKASWQVDGAPGQTATFAIPLPADAIEGSYRAVVVDGATGSTATAWFNVMPAERAAAMIDLVKQVDLTAGSTLVFVGDSLTANFPGRNYPAILQRALNWRFAGKVNVINAGVGGNNIVQIAARLERDVIARQPTRVFLFEGANDTKRPYRPADGTLGNWAVSQDRYEQTYREVVSALVQKGIKVAVMTCAPGDSEILAFFSDYKRIFAEGGNLFCLPEEVSRCVAIQKQAAADLGAEVIDTHTLLTQWMQQHPGANQHLHVDDGVHLSEYGAREVALIVLRYLADQNRP